MRPGGEGEEAGRLLLESYQQVSACSAAPLGVVVVDGARQVVCHGPGTDFLLDGQRLPPLWRPNGTVYLAGESPVELALAGQEVVQEEVCVRHNGAAINLLLSSFPLVDDKGRPVRAIAAFHDVTEERVAARRFARALEAERRRTQEMETLFTALSAFGQSLELEERIQTVARSLAEAAGADRAVIMQNRGGCFTMAGGCGMDETDLSLLSSLECTEEDMGEAARYVMGTGRPLVINDAANDPRMCDAARQLQFHSLLLVPLMNRGTATGVAYLERRGKRRLFFNSEIRLSVAIAGQAAVAIEQARLYQQEQEHSRLLSMMISELNHRVKNNLAIVAGLLSLQIADPRLSAKSKQLLRNTVTRIQSIAVIHELLKDDVRLVEMLDTTQRIAGLVSRTFSADGGVEIRVEGDPLLLPSKLATSLGVVINELFCNAIRHGLQGRTDGLVEARLRVGETKVRITVQDNGCGLPEGFDLGERMHIGGMIVRGLVEQLGGSFSLTNAEGGGTVAQLEFGRDHIERLPPDGGPGGPLARG